ncbi:MAG: hypothetical protein HYS07_06300 [Chlamydiae bacterium]|nr:hypothetical protein [Chlamydiota bacterium]MBI3277337.1 hypothetical protein [Chlamydiota bacterium]
MRVQTKPQGGKALWIWLFLGIPLFSYFVLKPTFNLSLYGDDWMQLYQMWLSFDVRRDLSFFSIHSYLGPYAPQYFFLGVLRYFFGYGPTAYFVTSAVLRILATFSLYFFTWEFTRSQKASFFSTLLFMVSFAGLESTDWVFNMNTYAGIFFLNFSLVFYLKMRELKKGLSWDHFFFLIFFTLALGIVPVRMSGAVPFIVMSDLFLLWVREKRRADPFFLGRIIPAAAVFLLLYSLGSFGDSSGKEWMVQRLQERLIDPGLKDFLYYLLGTLGHLSFPTALNLGRWSELGKSILFTTGLGLFIAWMAPKKRLASSLTVVIFNLVWLFCVYAIKAKELEMTPAGLFSIYAGGQVIFLSLLLFSLTQKKFPNLAYMTGVALLWIISFSAVFWLNISCNIEPTTRYFTMGSVGFAILLASFIGLLLKCALAIEKKFLRYILSAVPMLVLSFWIVLNLQASRLYLGTLEQNRNKVMAQEIWGDLLKNVPHLDEKGPSVFYFTYKNFFTINNLLLFGFWPHAGLSYGIKDEHLTPVPVIDYRQLLHLVKDGSPLKEVHGRPAIPVPISRVYAFDFRNGKLVNKTDETRVRVVEDLKKGLIK